MIEREVLQKKPNIEWTAIAGLKEAKSLLQEAVVLPNIVPDFFKVFWTISLEEHSWFWCIQLADFNNLQALTRLSVMHVFPELSRHTFKLINTAVRWVGRTYKIIFSSDIL